MKKKSNKSAARKSAMPISTKDAEKITKGKAHKIVAEMCKNSGMKDCR